MGQYWHNRLNFLEVDLYKNPYRAMSAGRTISREQRESPEALEGMLISLCTRLEQRMVKQEVFCRELSFEIRYKDFTRWDTTIKTTYPLQDAMEMRQYIKDRIQRFENERNTTLLNNRIQHMGVAIRNFIRAEHVSYTLFDNKMRQDKLRSVLYGIKDRYGRDIVRKASETIAPKVMTDAIGFGSVRDMYTSEEDPELGYRDRIVNKYLLEE